MYCFFAIICLLAIIIYTYGLWYRWTNYAEVDIIMSVVISLSVCFGLFFLYLVIRPTSFAIIQNDGLHIFSPEKKELTVVPWDNVKMCKWIRGEQKYWYAMLVIQLNATFCGKPVTTYKSEPRANLREVKKYRLDERMEALSQGKLTEEEFLNIPFLLLLADKNEFERYYAMWEAWKTRGQ